MFYLKISFPLFLLMICGLFACDDQTSSNNGSGPTPASGVWKVSYFFDKQDETSYYSGFTFEFGANGSLNASNGSQSWSGTWVTGFDDSANKFLIDFTGAIPSALAELEEDWRIVKMESNQMHFEHTSGGNGDTDVLKFIK